MRNIRLPLIVLACLPLFADRAWGLGEILGETKEQLKLKYEVQVHDHGNGRVTVVFTMSDEGRLRPVDDVELMVPTKEKDANGGYGADLSVSMKTTKDQHGAQTARFEMTREMAARAQIWLTTYGLDGTQEPLTRFHHVIEVGKYLDEARKGTDQPPATGGGGGPPATDAPPAAHAPGR